MTVTDRVDALIVALETDMRDDDVEQIRQAILCLRGVLSVHQHVGDIGSHMAKEQAKAYYRSKLLALMTKD